MAEAFLNIGATSLAPANWSDTAGFIDDAELVINEGNQDVTSGLNTTGTTTDGIDYLHIRPGFSGRIGGPAGSLQVEFDQTFTAKPNLIYAATGGQLYMTAATTCARLVVATSGKLFLTGGTFTTIEVQTGEVVINDQVSVTNLILAGGSATLDGHASNAPTLVRVTDGASVNMRRNAATVDVLGGRATLEALSGAFTTINVSGGGRVNMLQGNITTLNGFEGRIDHSRAKVPITVTTANLQPGFVRNLANVGGAAPTYTTVNNIAGGENMASISSGGGAL